MSSVLDVPCLSSTRKPSQAPSQEISTAEALAVFFIPLLIIFAELIWHQQFWNLREAWFDGAPYLQAADVIRHGGTIGQPYTDAHFLGFPIAVAGLARLLAIDSLHSLFLVPLVSCLCSMLLLCRLYGGVVAAALTILSLDWLQMAALGGSEPLFMTLLLAAFLASRKGLWLWTAMLASLATTVRSPGIFALLALALLLTCRRKWKKLIMVALIALVTGAAYLWFAQRITGDAFFNFRSYRADWGSSGFPITFPFGMMIASGREMFRTMSWGFSVKNLLGFGLTMLLAVIVWLRRHELLLAYPLETLTVAGYFTFFTCYNYSGLILNWPRFLLPVLPTMLFAAHRWLPRDRRIIWPAAIFAGLLASTAIGFKTVFGFALHH